jgi:TusA-related sulfurtransferase
MKDLESKREALDGLTAHVQELQGDRCDGPALEVRDAIRRLGMVRNQIINLLSEKEQRIKHGISRWSEFQKLYAELTTINDWFETREEAMNQYQKIVSKKEFAIALEDVKVRFTRFYHVCALFADGMDIYL